MSDGSPQQSGLEIHVAVFTDTADYHTAGADVHDQPVTSNRLMGGESGRSNNGVPGKYHFKLHELLVALRILPLTIKTTDGAGLVLFNVSAKTCTDKPSQPR